MSTSIVVKILVLGGVGNVLLSFVLGWVLSAYRLREPIMPHHWLLVAHTVSLQEGLLLFALAFAAQFAVLPTSVAVGAAVSLVVASVLQDASGIANWLRRTGDQFEARSFGWKLASANAILNTLGLLGLGVGIVRGCVA